MLCQSRSQSPRYPCPAVERPTRTGSPRILSWRIASPQSSLLAAPLLDNGNEDSGNEIGQVMDKMH